MSIVVNLANFLSSIPPKIKCWYKLHKYKANSTTGRNLTVGPMANIFCDNSARISIGHNCDLLCTLVARSKGNITIGDYTTIRGYSLVGAIESITIGNRVIISNNVHIYDNNNHPTSVSKRAEMSVSGFYSDKWSWSNSDSSPIVIEDNVWIGERSTILKGVTIGNGSIVACDSVVTKSVPPNCIVAGNPAKIVKSLEN